MSGALRLSGPSFRPKFIEVSYGTIVKSRRDTPAGPHELFTALGLLHFYVDLVEEDGGRLGLWSGTDALEAYREAIACRREFGIEEPIHDLFGGSD